jgi:uncharacterized protein
LKTLNITNRTKVGRLSKRGSYDIETINNILDESFICHIAFNIEGSPCIIPIGYGRKDDMIYFHGSKNNRMLDALRRGEDICVSVTLTDGIVLARSAFHMSINYRSVIMYGKAVEVIGNAEKEEALRIISEHIIPGRWDDVRKPDEKELYGTSVFSFEINEASAKVRTGPPLDDKTDMDRKIWAGVLPLNVLAGVPVPDPNSLNEMPVPDYVTCYKKNT